MLNNKTTKQLNDKMPQLEYGTLYLPDTRATGTGRSYHFKKGEPPHNKGKRWDDYLTPDAQRKCAKGWDNLRKHRAKPMEMPAVLKARRKPVIAVYPDGSWRWFKRAQDAADAIGDHNSRSHICQVCIHNQNNAPTRYKGNNSDHAHKGVRYYYETDNNWLSKIKQ